MVLESGSVQAMGHPGASPVLSPSELASFASAEVLARDIADLLGCDFRGTWGILVNYPHTILSLLDSPQGWTALGAFVAEDFGCELPGYALTVH